VNRLTQRSAPRAMLLSSADPQLGATSMGHLGRTQKSPASAMKLRAYARELEQKLEARTRDLSEALEQAPETAAHVLSSLNVLLI
jgi:hypothetical protein